MSTRIIIEKDGERYVANELTARFIDGGSEIGVENKLSNDYIGSTYTLLPPIIRTDNSEVIAKLEAGIKKLANDILSVNEKCYKLESENAKLREALKPIMACDVSFKNSPCGLCWGLNDNCMEARFCGRYSFFRAVRKAQEIMKGETK